MVLQLTTRHSEDFDVHSKVIDPALSSYAQTVQDYVSRINAFYMEIGVSSAVWTVHASDHPKFLEPSKPVEYLLEVSEDRIVAYVDEITWSDYLYGRTDSFDYAITPTRYEMTSILVTSPITESEVKAFRRYRPLNGPDKYELVEEIIF